MRVYNFALRSQWIYKCTQLHKIEAKALDVWHGLISDVIRKRRQELVDSGNKDDHKEDAAIDELGIRKKRALCDILLRSTADEQPMSDLDIHEEVNTYISAVNIALLTGFVYLFECVSAGMFQ